jgi:hypothetical protein
MERGTYGIQRDVGYWISNAECVLGKELLGGD